MGKVQVVSAFHRQHPGIVNKDNLLFTVEEVNSTTQSKDFATHFDEFLHFGQLHQQHSHRSYNPYTSIISVENGNSNKGTLRQQSNSALAVRDPNICQIQEEGEEMIQAAPQSPIANGGLQDNSLQTPVPRMMNLPTATSSTLQSISKVTSSEKKV